MSSSIRQWLDSINLLQDAEAFESNDIDVDLFAEVNDHVLRDIGVISAGHPLRIPRAISGPPALSKGNSDRTRATQARGEQQDPYAPEAERRQLLFEDADMGRGTLVPSTKEVHDAPISFNVA